MLRLQVDTNIVLRELEPAFSEEIVGLVLSNYDHLSKWLPWVNEDYSAKTTLRFIEISGRQAEEKQCLQMSIFVNDKLVGGVGLNLIDLANRAAEIGYWLGRQHVGRGIMTKCCAALIDHAFEEFRLNRIVIRCATENTKSQAIPLRLGFKEEGILREAEKLHNEYVDLKVFSLLAGERDPS